MRILFYVEPFPIRNSMTHFADVARNAAKLIGNDTLFDLRIYANSSTLAGLDEATRKAKSRHIIAPTDTEESLFISNLTNWDVMVSNTGAISWPVKGWQTNT